MACSGCVDFNLPNAGNSNSMGFDFCRDKNAGRLLPRSRAPGCRWLTYYLSRSTRILTAAPFCPYTKLTSSYSTDFEQR